MIQFIKNLFGNRKMEDKATKAINAASQKQRQQQEIEVARHNATFVQNHKKAVAQWNKTHPGQQLPVFKDSSGKLHWKNRQQRRK